MATDRQKPLNERERIAALQSYRVLDTPPEKAYDDITTIAAQLCGTPMALVSLVDSNRQWFKSRLGVEEKETPRNIAFCDRTIQRDRVMVIQDTHQDERFRDNPLVTGSPHIRFYAGAPLIDSTGYGLGALCVIDRQPRELSDQQVAALEALGRLVIDQLEQRKASSELAEALDRVRLLDELVPVCSYCQSIRQDPEFWQGVVTFIREQSGADTTHGICPDCLQIEIARTAS